MLKRTYTRLLTPLQINIFNSSSMFKLASQPGINLRVIRPLLHNSISTRRYAVHNNFKFKSSGTKKYASDGSVKHVVKTKTLCDEQDCENKNCKTPCSDLVEIEASGHYTHFPPSNTKSSYLDNVDFNGKPKNQYFVKSSNPTKISPKDLKDLTEDDMEPSKAADLYSQLPHIFPKVK